MKIYTRTGDRGDTSLFGGKRVRKDDPRIAAYGSIDELNSFIGVARAASEGWDLDADLERIQSDLFDIGAMLAAPESDRFEGVAPGRAEDLEQAIDRAEGELEPLASFILPGGSTLAAHLHVARTVCRRAERLVVSLEDERARNTLVYLNRLSDFLFVAARLANRRLGSNDVVWRKG